MSFTYAQLKDRVRTLTGVWSVDVVTDNIIYSLLSDATTALDRSQQWNLVFRTYTGNSGITPGDGWDEYHVILAYRVASQVLALEADDTQRSQFFAQEYDKMYQEMFIHFLPKTATGAVTGTVEMVKYVRDLTGQYGQDLPTSLIRSWLNEIYQELFTTYDWPTAGSPTWTTVNSLTVADPDAGIGAKYHSLFCYYVAAKILAPIPDGQARAALYKEEYDKLLAVMIGDFFPRGAGVTLDDAGMRLNVRFLTGDYTRALSSSLIDQYINEADDEIVRKNYWANTLVQSSGVPLGWRRILVYRAAARIIAGTGRDDLVASFNAEYDSLLAELKIYFLTNNSAGSADSTYFLEMKRHFRTITNMWDNTVSDTAIGNWINDAYTELAQSKPWPWLEQTATATFNVSAGATTQTLPNGTRRVLGVYFLKGGDEGVPDQWLAVPHLLDIEKYAPRTVYDIGTDGVLRWSPETPESGQLRVQYVKNITRMSDDFSQPLFDVRFRPILVYRAAMRWASMNGDKDRVQTFQSEYESMLEQMENEYLLDHDTNPLQLGSEGLETRRYLPWFRTA